MSRIQKDTRPGLANGLENSTTRLRIGDVERDGDHKGEIYGGIYPADNQPIWFSVTPKLMDHYSSAAWAQDKGGDLPTKEQYDYLHTIKDQGALRTFFNRTASPTLLAKLNLITILAWCKRLTGGQDYDYRNVKMPGLSVRR